MENITLYSYCKSSAAYRVRIALNLKSIPYNIIPINLLPGIAQNFTSPYIDINPQGLIPSIKVDEDIITQSSAILEYLDEKFIETPLLPTSLTQRAYVRCLVQLINCDIHPLNNLRTLDFLKTEFNCNSDLINKWYCHWISTGLSAFEEILKAKNLSGDFCCGNTPGIADTSLIPQLYNAHRFKCDTNQYEAISSIEEHCLKLDAFTQASPEMQQDYTA